MISNEESSGTGNSAVRFRFSRPDMLLTRNRIGSIEEDEYKIKQIYIYNNYNYNKQEFDKEQITKENLKENTT